MRTLPLVGLILGLSGCSGDNIGITGYSMDDFFPFDGVRTWTFQNEDEIYEVRATLSPDHEAAPDEESIQVYTIDYAIVCPEDGECTEGPWRISQLRMSSDGTYGTFIYGMTDGSGEHSYDPPIGLTGRDGIVGDVISTETAGTSFDSEFAEIGACPDLPISDTWEDCVRFEVTGGDHPLHGTYYAIKGWNLVGFQFNDDASLWRLSAATYEDE